jgi:hypothetical protein
MGCDIWMPAIPGTITGCWGTRPNKNLAEVESLRFQSKTVFLILGSLSIPWSSSVSRLQWKMFSKKLQFNRALCTYVQKPIKILSSVVSTICGEIYFYHRSIIPTWKDMKRYHKIW